MGASSWLLHSRHKAHCWCQQACWYHKRRHRRISSTCRYLQEKELWVSPKINSFYQLAFCSFTFWLLNVHRFVSGVQWLDKLNTHKRDVANSNLESKSDSTQKKFTDPNHSFLHTPELSTGLCVKLWFQTDIARKQVRNYPNLVNGLEAYFFIGCKHQVFKIIDQNCIWNLHDSNSTIRQNCPWDDYCPGPYIFQQKAKCLIT